MVPENESVISVLHSIAIIIIDYLLFFSNNTLIHF